jgi:HAD superfamily hydrolase (TIGR01549 family)
LASRWAASGTTVAGTFGLCVCATGFQIWPDQWCRLAWLWYQPLSELAEVEPDTARTLSQLRGRGLKLGIVSNTFVNSSSLEKHLQQLGILDFFAVRLYSYQFAFRKPNIRMFKTAAERIGEMLENILFVGDRIDADIRPAMKVGMQAVLKKAYTNEGKTTPKGAWKIDRLAELPALVEKINARAAGNQPQNSQIKTSYTK